MQGHKQFTDKVVTQFRLSERVPRHNLYRRLSELLLCSESRHSLASSPQTHCSATRTSCKSLPSLPR
jgi:hypothetical protein